MVLMNMLGGCMPGVMSPKVRSLFQREAQPCARRLELKDSVERAVVSLENAEHRLKYQAAKRFPNEQALEVRRAIVVKRNETLENAKAKLAKVRPCERTTTPTNASRV